MALQVSCQLPCSTPVALRLKGAMIIKVSSVSCVLCYVLCYGHEVVRQPFVRRGGP